MKRKEEKGLSDVPWNNAVLIVGECNESHMVTRNVPETVFMLFGECNESHTITSKCH